ncbi:CAP domain-containing protein [Virgibacillus xinjiangensis]|uniref:CAP domain-containing protein n=1 Tax=Virgibacillus xinjiangensis TaxID=393090 RepID=A0ABV7CUR3_9BACI
MRFLKSMFVLAVLVYGGSYLFDRYGLSAEGSIEKMVELVEEKRLQLESKESAPQQEDIPWEGSLFEWMGKPTAELEEQMGDPDRRDDSPYGYTWWVYTDQASHYLQFAIEEQKIISVYAIGKEVDIEPVSIGDSYTQVSEHFSFTEQVSYQDGLSSYTFHLSPEDLQKRPLAKISDDLYVQAYFDTFTDQLSSIRIMNGDVLLTHRPYQVEYRGSLPEEPELTDQQWTEIEKGMEQQVFDITNIIRHQFEKSLVRWEENVSEVAYGHSKDMAEQDYFSHTSLNGDGLKERLALLDIPYMAAGENIAAQYPDAPSAMHGWLNSEGHRQALLNEDYTHLGVGVYHFHYTQNFIKQLSY